MASTSTKDSVLAHLRREKFRLWLPPYQNLPTQGGGANDEALSKLAESLQEKIDGRPAVDEIRGVLVELQTHAVHKLKEKNSVVINIKILATKQHFAALPEGDHSAFPSASGWGDEVACTTRDNKSLHIRVVNLSPSLTIDEFSSDLCRGLDAQSVRVIWKGKNLLSNGDALRKIVTNDNRTAGTAPTQKKKSELLCLVSGFGYVPPAASAASASGTSTTNPPDRTDSDIIDSIRQAARTIQNSTRGPRFDVTDQHGNLVPMHQSDTVAFLTALGLHRIGRSRLELDPLQQTSEDDSCKRDAVASALVFLLEADAMWENSPTLANWRDKVDNYGLLQMDIAWCYLLLESLEDLSDAVRRLDIAEKVIRKQVHSNFVTLALAQAEMNNQIPPLCAIFVRLFLLQGVANKMQNCNATSAERLEWASLLCNRLRSSSPEDSVEHLCNAYFVDPSTAITALRRSNGNPDAAGNFITLDRDEERQAAKKRRRQHKLGKCANGLDFVNLEIAQTLNNLLGFRGEAEAFQNEQSTSASIVVGLLRLANNDIDQALELYNTTGAEQVLERAARLDETSGRRKRRSARNERQKPSDHEVRDVDLTMIISMGVEVARGREALKATGNVESAILWLSTDDNNNDDTKTSDTKAGEDATSTADSDRATENDTNNAASDPSESDGNGSTSESDKIEIDNAHELLERELGNALGADSKHLLEKEWLGADMKKEWDLIQKYI